MHRVYRCYAEGANGQWEVICLDLDIAVQGESFKQVFDDMTSAIELYLKHVTELPEPDRVRLMNRRAPILTQWKFAMAAVMTVFGSRQDSGKSRAEFMIPAAA